MPMSSAFFTAEVDSAGNYDRVYTAEIFARYFASFIGNGVFPNPSTNLQVLAPSSPGFYTETQVGKGWINGYFGWTIGTEYLNHSISSGTYDRYDAVVVRWSNAGRTMTLAVKEGEPAYAAVKPVPQRDDDVWELILAYVFIGRGVSTITQLDIEDTRYNSELCGIVHGVVDQVDTTTIAIQLQGFIDSYIQLSIARYDEYLVKLQEQLDAYQQEFNDWWDDIKEILDDDAVGNILNILDSHQTQLTYLQDNVYTKDQVYTKAEVDHLLETMIPDVPTATGTVEGVVRLSDTPNASLGVNNGYAATPASVATRAPINHASPDNTVPYGLGTNVNFGHVKLTDTPQSLGELSGTALTANGGLSILNTANAAQSAAGNAQITADNAYNRANSAYNTANIVNNYFQNAEARYVGYQNATYLQGPMLASCSARLHKISLGYLKFAVITIAFVQSGGAQDGTSMYNFDLSSITTLQSNSWVIDAFQTTLTVPSGQPSSGVLVKWDIGVSGWSSGTLRVNFTRSQGNTLDSSGRLTWTIPLLGSAT